MTAPCALWRQTHCLHPGRRRGCRGENACMRSSYTQAHAPHCHGNKHLLAESWIFLFFFFCFLFSTEVFGKLEISNEEFHSKRTD